MDKAILASEFDFAHALADMKRQVALMKACTLSNELAAHKSSEAIRQSRELLARMRGKTSL